MSNRQAVYRLSLGIIQGQILFLGIIALWIWQGARFWNTGKLDDRLFVAVPIGILFLLFLLAFRGYVKVIVNSQYIVFSHMFPIFVRNKVKLVIRIKDCSSIVVNYSRRTHRFNNVYFHPWDKSKDVVYHSGTDAGLARFLAAALNELGYKVAVGSSDTDTGVEIRFTHKS